MDRAINVLSKTSMLRSQKMNLGGALLGGIAGAGTGYNAGDDGEKLKSTIIGGMAGAGAGYFGRKKYSKIKHKSMYREGSKKSRNIYDESRNSDGMTIGNKKKERKEFFSEMRKNKQRGGFSEDSIRNINSDMIKKLKERRKKDDYFKRNEKYKKGMPGYQSERRARTDRGHMDFEYFANPGTRPKNRVKGRENSHGPDYMHRRDANFVNNFFRAKEYAKTKSGSNYSSGQNFRSSDFDSKFKGKTQEEKKRLYRQLSRKHHPDFGGDPEKMKDLNEAYEKAKRWGL